MSTEELTALLGTLRAHDVGLAEFSPEGQLTRVVFGSPPPVEEEPRQETEKLKTAKRAVDVLSGKWRPEDGMVG